MPWLLTLCNNLVCLLKQISADGTIAAMGSWRGAVATYQYQASGWATYVPRLGLGHQAYSLALSHDGQALAIGSLLSPSRSRWSGHVSFYRISGSESSELKWGLRSEIYGVRPNARDGSAVALSKDGNVLVVGGLGYTDPSRPAAEAAGRCRIFEWQDYRFVEIHTINGENAGETLGRAVAVSDNGDVVACGGTGAKWYRSMRVNSGAVRLWNRSTSLEKSLYPIEPGLPALHSVAVQKGEFGSSIAMDSDGKILSVGASQWVGLIPGLNGNPAGGVHIFDGFKW